MDGAVSDRVYGTPGRAPSGAPSGGAAVPRDVSDGR